MKLPQGWTVGELIARGGQARIFRLDIEGDERPYVLRSPVNQEESVALEEELDFYA
jgi:hypothetical protein